MKVQFKLFNVFAGASICACPKPNHGKVLQLIRVHVEQNLWRTDHMLCGLDLHSQVDLSIVNEFIFWGKLCMNTEDSNAMKEHVRKYVVNNPSFPKKRITKERGKKIRNNVICIICTLVPEGQIHNMYVVAHVSPNNKRF